MRRFFHFSAKVIRSILIVLVIFLLALMTFLNSNFFDSIIRDLIQKKLGKAIHRTVTVDAVDFNPFFLDIDLKNFTIGNDPRSPDFPFFTAPEIYARVSWKNLLAGRVRVSDVRLEKPQLNIVFYKSGGDKPPGPRPSQKKGGGVKLIIQKNVRQPHAHPNKKQPVPTPFFLYGSQ